MVRLDVDQIELARVVGADALIYLRRKISSWETEMVFLNIDGVVLYWRDASLNTLYVVREGYIRYCIRGMHLSIH